MNDYPTTQCPECKKGLVNIGSYLIRIHPIPKFLREHNDRIFQAWVLLSILTTILIAISFDDIDMRFIMFFWMGMIAFGGVILFLIPKFFDVYRVTECPYCGYHKEKNIGKGLGV